MTDFTPCPKTAEQERARIVAWLRTEAEALQKNTWVSPSAEYRVLMQAAYAIQSNQHGGKDE